MKKNLTIQSLILSKEAFSSKRQAKRWVFDRGHRTIKCKESPDSWVFSVSDPDLIEYSSLERWELEPGVAAIGGKNEDSNKFEAIPAMVKFSTGDAVDFVEHPESKTRRFEMVAYTGAAVETSFGAMVVDLAGLDVAQKTPILLNHDLNQIAGLSENTIKDGESLLVAGELYPGEPAGATVARLSDRGFPWQASMGFKIQKLRYIDDGEFEIINSQEFRGPGLIVTEARLLENSFTALGRDSATSAAAFSEGSGEITIKYPGRDDHMDIEKFTEENPETIRALQEKSALDAKTELKSQLRTLIETFAGRLPFAVECFMDDLSIIEGKARLADILLSEGILKDREIRDLQAKAHQPGIGFNASERERASDKPSYAGLSPDERGATEWSENPQIRQAFLTQADYVAFLKANEKGLVAIKELKN